MVPEPSHEGQTATHHGRLAVRGRLRGSRFRCVHRASGRQLDQSALPLSPPSAPSGRRRCGASVAHAHDGCRPAANASGRRTHDGRHTARHRTAANADHAAVAPVALVAAAPAGTGRRRRLCAVHHVPAVRSVSDSAAAKCPAVGTVARRATADSRDGCSCRRRRVPGGTVVDVRRHDERHGDANAGQLSGAHHSEAVLAAASSSAAGAAAATYAAAAALASDASSQPQPQQSRPQRSVVGQLQPRAQSRCGLIGRRGEVQPRSSGHFIHFGRSADDDANDIAVVFVAVVARAHRLAGGAFVARRFDPERTTAAALQGAVLPRHVAGDANAQPEAQTVPAVQE